MRDNFTTRFEPEDMKGLPDWTNVNWLGLYNRPYAFEILAAAGKEAKVRLTYSAPDIYPKGVELERTLSLQGDQDVVVSETALTPAGIDKPQAYVLETSVPFKSLDGPAYNQFFTRGRAPEEFTPTKRIDLAGARGVVGTVNKQSGETFALLSLTSPARMQLAVENHSALIRVTYPQFEQKDETYRYRVAYYFGKAAPGEVESLLTKLK